MLFEVTEHDKAIYNNELKDFLPEKMIDIHCHMWKKELLNEPSRPNEIKRIVTWPSLVAKDNSVDDLIETYKLMFPSKKVTPLMFTNPTKGETSALNDYVAEAAKLYNFPSLYFSKPEETEDELKNEILKNGFLGIKSYLNLAPDYIPEDEIRIYDFFPKHQLRAIDDLGGIVMLHIPRRKRFRDPVNIEIIKEIASEYKHLQLIIAHIGRAYIPSDLGNSLTELAPYKNLMYDFCANTSEYAMTELIKSVGSKRIMFGSDLPILRMRMRRIEENGTYINLVPPKIYGDVSVDPHLREVSESEAKKLTFFMYEELLAFKAAAKNTGLCKEDIENVFYNNAYNLINKTRKNIADYKAGI